MTPALHLVDSFLHNNSHHSDMVFMLLLVACVCSAAVDAQQQGFEYDQSNQHSPHQQQLPRSAIVLHKQALGQDGSFNYAFSADNGLQQGETISPDGSRTGSYSYVDPNGKTISVKYTAGKEGFKILEGDHVPKAAVPIPAPPQPYADQQYYQPQQQQQQYYQPQQHVGALFHRAQPVKQPAVPVQRQYVPYQTQHAPARSSSLGYIDKPFRETFAGFGSESRFASVLDEINSKSLLNSNDQAQLYSVHEDHGESQPTNRLPTQGKLFQPVNGGPVTFPSVPQRQRAPVQRYSQASNQDNQQYDNIEEDQGPHTFGNGYSFEFAG